MGARVSPVDHLIDHSLGTVRVYSRDKRLPPKIASCIDIRIPVVVDNFAGLPRGGVDYYIVASLNASVESEAARLGAIPVSLPAAAGWLADKISRATQQHRDVHICMRRIA